MSQARPRLDHQVDNGRQDQRTARQQVEGQLHGPVLLAGAAPDGDEQVHGKQGDIEPDEDEKQVQAHEQAEYTGDEQKNQGEKLFYAQFQLPHGQDRRKEYDSGEKQHGQAEAVSRIEVSNPQRRHPRQLLGKLQTAEAFVVSKEEIDGKNQGYTGANRTDPLDGRLAFRRDE